MDQKKQSTAPLRNLPSVDQLLKSQEGLDLQRQIGLKRLTAIARSSLSEMRIKLRRELRLDNGHSTEFLLAETWQMVHQKLRLEGKLGIRRVINATGVLLHTNLGRAPLSQAAIDAIGQESAGYCTLEYDATTGSRGKRGARVESLLCELTGAEDALVVNNCAAAALLILKVLAGDGETLVSRGELVEIGGDFRVPDVMSSSGTRMVEVGTTNRTHLTDYEKAISSTTRLILRVHPSNYRIVGFASSPSLPELAGLAHSKNLPLYEDAGSGALHDLSTYGIKDEPTIEEIIKAGADVVSFSGDKLLGSAQAGLIVGKALIVEQLRKHPLYRALRSDKLRLVALEETLVSYQHGNAFEEVPVLRMIQAGATEIQARALKLAERVENPSIKLEVVAGESAIGGGAGPTSIIQTALLAISHETLGAQEIVTSLRNSKPPVIARIAEDKVVLDLRTVFSIQEQALVFALNQLLSQEKL
ncbi:MAG TPA: L-seryl-tRNA(Sec) selenium transferase [Pyrinomonadaceae bacterium]|nr:L-seryl-tRNA(Sec) selenium transferase [Pyrinomonadaceae bacterium]